MTDDIKEEFDENIENEDEYDELFSDEDDEYEEDLESKSPDSVYTEDAWTEDD